ncbi:MAG: nuclear transport factor 2 family protein [Acidobacteriota bacterium]
MKTNIQEQIETTARGWAAAFNRQDAAGCAACYVEDATMHAEPLAQVRGRKDIESFWQGLMDAGYRDVRYLDPKVEVLSDTRARLTSPWSMNLAKGMIHDEQWMLCEDGRWRLEHDHFEILENLEPPSGADS